MTQALQAAKQTAFKAVLLTAVVLLKVLSY